jgi:hypothetical protein
MPILLVYISVFLLVCKFAIGGIGLHGEKVFSSADVGIYTQLAAADSSVWENHGLLNFSGASSIVNNSGSGLFSGPGLVLFSGNTAQDISGNSLSIPGVFTLDNPYGLNLGCNLLIGRQANLKDGIIYSAADTVFILSAAAGALQADISRFSSGYIAGAAARLAPAGSWVDFPIGGPGYISPLSIENAGTETMVYARYIYSQSCAISPLYFYGYTFSPAKPQHYWQLGGYSSIPYSLRAYHYDAAGSDVQYALGINTAAQICGSWQVAGSPSFISAAPAAAGQYYTQADMVNGMGYISLLSANSADFKIANLIRLGDGSETRFIIPGLADMGSRNLVLFSRAGNKIYETGSYDNSFDFKDKPTGTYYYVFDYEYKGQKGQRKSYVEVVK